MLSRFEHEHEEKRFITSGAARDLLYLSHHRASKARVSQLSLLACEDENSDQN